jgi:hypothetical protein
MEELLEDYKRRLITMNQMIDDNTFDGSVLDIRRSERLRTKASEYRTFISELEMAIKKDEPKDALIKELAEALKETTKWLNSISIAENIGWADKVIDNATEILKKVKP